VGVAVESLSSRLQSHLAFALRAAVASLDYFIAQHNKTGSPLGHRVS